MGITTTLNKTELRTAKFVNTNPLHSITKQDFLESLKRSDNDIKHGRVKDARIAVEEIFAKHGY